jgi:hypothetical protein
MNCLVNLLPNSDALDLAALGRDGGRKTARPRKLDPAKGEAFIKQNEDFLHGLAGDETVIFAGAAHPAHAARPALCRAAKGQKFVSGQTSGRDRCDIRGAVDPEQGNARMIEAPTVDAWRRIALSTAIAIMDPFKWRTQAFLENARRHHADRATQWLAREGMPDRTAPEQSASNALDARRVAERSSRLTVPIPIARSRGAMHKNVAHNKSLSQIQNAGLNFLRGEVPIRAFPGNVLSRDAPWTGRPGQA